MYTLPKICWTLCYLSQYGVKNHILNYLWLQFTLEFFYLIPTMKNSPTLKKWIKWQYQYQDNSGANNSSKVSYRSILKFNIRWHWPSFSRFRSFLVEKWRLKGQFSGSDTSILVSPIIIMIPSTITTGITTN